MAKTLQTRFSEALERRGQTLVKKQGDSLVYTRGFEGPTPTFYFLGPAGAVRYGRSKTTSFAASDSFKAKLLNGTA